MNQSSVSRRAHPLLKKYFFTPPSFFLWKIDTFWLVFVPKIVYPYCLMYHIKQFFATFFWIPEQVKMMVRSKNIFWYHTPLKSIIKDFLAKKIIFAKRRHAPIFCFNILKSVCPKGFKTLDGSMVTFFCSWICSRPLCWHSEGGYPKTIFCTGEND